MRAQATRIPRPQAVRVSWLVRLLRMDWRIDATSAAWASVVVWAVLALCGVEF